MPRMLRDCCCLGLENVAVDGLGDCCCPGGAQRQHLLLPGPARPSQTLMVARNTRMLAPSRIQCRLVAVVAGAGGGDDYDGQSSRHAPAMRPLPMGPTMLRMSTTRKRPARCPFAGAVVVVAAAVVQSKMNYNHLIGCLRRCCCSSSATHHAGAADCLPHETHLVV